MKRAILGLAAGAVLAVTASGCLFNSMRRDFDDQREYMSEEPVTGGLFAERGLLSEEEDGRWDRGLASARDQFRGGRDSWMSEEHAMANRRDMIRGQAQDAMADANANVDPNMPEMPSRAKKYKNGARATRDDFIDQVKDEGSLWASDGQTNYYFTKNKVRGVGDLVSITMEPDLIRDISSELKKTLSEDERDREIELAQARIDAQAQGLPDPDKPADDKSKPADPTASPKTADASAAPKESREATANDIDLTRSIQIKSGEPMMAEIVERYPNGNYKIRAAKKVLYKSGSPRLLNLVGIARGSDIGEDDVVSSGKLYEYRLQAVR